MRVVTFAVGDARCTRQRWACTPRTRCLRHGRRRLRETVGKLKADGVVGDDVELQVVTGNGWDEALDAPSGTTAKYWLSAPRRGAA